MKRNVNISNSPVADWEQRSSEKHHRKKKERKKGVKVVKEMVIAEVKENGSRKFVGRENVCSILKK
jgi:hypothetical protein